MSSPLKSLDNWSYNSASDVSSYYKMNKDFVKNESFNVEIEENDKGVNYLHVNKDSVDERVHVFISKGLLTSIKYFFLKYFSNNWTEVELCKQDNNKPKKLSLLIDNKELMLNREFTKSITSVFDFALRPKIKELEQVPAKPVEFADSLIQEKKMEARQNQKKTISTEWSHSPQIEKLFLKQLELDFENEQVGNEIRAKIVTFADWYEKNKYISLTNKDPLSEEFHKEMIRKLFEGIAEINRLPAEFEEDGLDIKKEFISKIYDHFLSAFQKETEDLQRLKQKEPFKNCINSILLITRSHFNGKDLQFVEEELSWRNQLVFLSFQQD